MFLIILIQVATAVACYFLGVLVGRRAERIDNDNGFKYRST